MKSSTFCFILLILFSFSALAQFNFLPDTVDNHQILTYTQFTLSYNEEHEQAEWVAYELTKEEVLMNVTRCDCFATDHDVTTVSAVRSDYLNTGFERGHLSPSEDNQMSDDVNEESFLFSNMSPQLKSLNNGIWKKLEKWVRDQALEFDTVYVVTGPVFINNLGSIGPNNVTIPGYFYKTLLRFNDAGKAKAIAFLIPHVGAVGELKDYVASVNTIETLTGLEFYPALDDNENLIESKQATTQWGL